MGGGNWGSRAQIDKDNPRWVVIKNIYSTFKQLGMIFGVIAYMIAGVCDALSGSHTLVIRDGRIVREQKNTVRVNISICSRTQKCSSRTVQKFANKIVFVTNSAARTNTKMFVANKKGELS